MKTPKEDDPMLKTLESAALSSELQAARWRRGWRSSFTKALIGRYERVSEMWVTLKQLRQEGIDRKVFLDEVEELTAKTSALSIDIERSIHESFLARTNIALTIVIGLATLAGVATQIYQVIRSCE